MIKVLTLSWNGLDKLQTLRPGLIKNLQNTGESFGWRIRDNGSKDNTVQEISKWEYVELLGKDHNRDNFAQGMNSLAWLDFKVQPEDYYLLLNNDVEFFDDQSLNKMFQLAKFTNASVVGARLLYKNTSRLQHAGVIFSQRYNFLPYHYRPNEESDAQAEKNREFQAVTAAVCLVKAQDFLDVNGMDPKFVWSFDDIDLCLKLKSAGKKIVYCGGTKIYHEESASLKKNPVNKMFVSSNVSYFKSKWSGKYEIDHDLYLKNPNYKAI